MSDMSAPSSEPSATVTRHTTVCQHDNFHEYAIGINEDDTDGIVNITYHYWCNDCNTGFSHKSTMSLERYRQFQQQDFD